MSTRAALERRYRRLLLAYPRDYRDVRGEEIVGTYLDLAGADRRWPSPTDAADLLRGGLRQRLRAAGAADLIPGVRLAAVLAFSTATALAGVWAAAETRPTPAWWGLPTFGPVRSIGAIAWGLWLLAALVAVAAPGRPTRIALGSALAGTVAVLPVAALADLPRPPLIVLVPQIALGVLALALPDRLPIPARSGPLLLAAASAVLAANALSPVEAMYRLTATRVLPWAGGILLMIALLLGIGLAMRQDHRGMWAILVLLTPVGLLTLHLLAGGADGLRGAPGPGWAALAATTVGVCLLGPAVLPLALTIRRRSRRAADVTNRCPTCGAHR